MFDIVEDVLVLQDFDVVDPMEFFHRRVGPIFADFKASLVNSAIPWTDNRYGLLVVPLG